MDNNSRNTQDSEEKAVLNRLAKWDKSLSKQLALCSSLQSPWGHLRPYMRLLEYSCHGVPWFVGVAVLLLMSHQFEMQQRLLNLFSMLVFDVLAVGLTKATVRRQRPAENAPDMMTVSVDKYSFPSGHASRAFMIAMFLVIHFHISVMWTCIVWLWAVSVAMSRILLGRHHISDVVAGTFLGCIECSIVNCCNLWLSADLCNYIIRPLQEELHL